SPSTPSQVGSAGQAPLRSKPSLSRNCALSGCATRVSDAIAGGLAVSEVEFAFAAPGSSVRAAELLCAHGLVRARRRAPVRPYFLSATTTFPPVLTTSIPPSGRGPCDGVVIVSASSSEPPWLRPGAGPA